MNLSVNCVLIWPSKVSSLEQDIYIYIPSYVFRVIKVACTFGLKCLYSLVNYFYRNIVRIFMKPHINLFQK